MTLRLTISKNTLCPDRMKRGVQKVGSSIKPLAKYAYPLINALFSGSVNFSLVDQSKYL